MDTTHSVIIAVNVIIIFMVIIIAIASSLSYCLRINVYQQKGNYLFKELRLVI